MDDKNLTGYLNDASERLVKNILKSAIGNPKEIAFLLRYRGTSKAAKQKRNNFESAGQHIPVFLISSITDSCNLFCTGCYARANGSCGGEKKEKLMTKAEWGNVFRQAKDLGIAFNLLAGGEPLLRKDVLKEAAKVKEILFPIFTNGLLIDNTYIKIFDKYRNLIPIISMEGNEYYTDSRRGEGTYGKLLDVMDNLNQSKILFGASITVTSENLKEVTSQGFLEMLSHKGCKAVLFIEYVPIDSNTQHLALSEEKRWLLERKQDELRNVYHKMIFLSFPGDEKYMGGCLAAGRGFLHINPYGSAEACPFSPYSDTSLKTNTLQEALNSPFFKRLQEDRLVGGEHDGGCALFANEEKVKLLLGTALQ